MSHVSRHMLNELCHTPSSSVTIASLLVGWLLFSASLVLCFLAVLCKETGLTAVGLCAAWDVCIWHVINQRVSAKPGAGRMQVDQSQRNGALVSKRFSKLKVCMQMMV
jgi:hypothetical protein